MNGKIGAKGRGEERDVSFISDFSSGGGLTLKRSL